MHDHTARGGLGPKGREALIPTMPTIHDEVMAAYQYGRHSLSPDRVHVSTLIERLPRPIPTDHGPSDPVIRVGGVWRRTSDIESSELVAALRVCPSMADTRVMPVISSEPVAVIC